MPEPITELAITNAPELHARAVIIDGVAAFNYEKTRHSDYEPLAVLATDPDTGEVLGGLLGKTYLGLFQIERIFVPEQLRGQGLGSRILSVAEDTARARGCVQAAAIMVSFQAPGFSCHAAGTWPPSSIARNMVRRTFL